MPGELPEYLQAVRPVPRDQRAAWYKTTAQTYASVMLWFVFWQGLPGAGGTPGGSLAAKLVPSLAGLEGTVPVPPRLQPAAEGIGSQVRAAREAQGLSWYAVAKLAKIPNPATVRDIEYGRDTKVSSLQAVAKALGLRLELVGV